MSHASHRPVFARPPGTLQQVAYLTEDLDRSIDHWVKFAGTGPWVVYKNVTLTGELRGKSCTVKIDVALSYQGELQIELIQPVTPGPSPYHHATGKIMVGMHHVAWLSTDLSADIKQALGQGLIKVFEATNGATRVAYFDNPSEPGLLMEYIEISPDIRAGYAAGIAASHDWDGVTQTKTVIDLAG
jgi:methylmalonyl-CoA/ethylmalonyl-CoA epimerase